MFDDRTLDLVITIGLLAMSTGVFLYGRSVAARPVDLARVRMLPWNAILIGLAFIMLILLVHLVNLLGVQTGRPVS
jgi:hypothetical protein